MGWSYGWNSMKEVHDYVLSASMTGPDMKVIAHCSKAYGRRLWVVFEKSDGFRFIALFLCNGGRVNGRKGDPIEYGYKDIDESQGPVDIDCPLSYLTLAPYVEGKSGEYAKAWRERVRAHGEALVTRRAHKYSIGDPVIVHGRHYTITGTSKRSYILDYRYKCGPSKMRPADKEAGA